MSNVFSSGISQCYNGTRKTSHAALNSKKNIMAFLPAKINTMHYTEKSIKKYAFNFVFPVPSYFQCRPLQLACNKIKTLLLLYKLLGSVVG